MISKIFVLTCVVAVCRGGAIHSHAVSSQHVVRTDEVHHHDVPDYHGVPSVHHEPLGYLGSHHDKQHSHPKYKYEYSVSDPHTGDQKSHHESRDGDVVHGEYTLLQPDGWYRNVKYSADDHHGLNAVVHNSPRIHHAEHFHH